MLTDNINNHLNAETNLNGKWEELIINCPFCDNSNYVYIYDDNKTCFCLSCCSEFCTDDTVQFTGEANFVPEITDKQITLEDTISDDPVLANQMANKIISSANDSKKCGICNKIYTGDFIAHFNKSECKDYTRGDVSQYTFKSCSHPPRHVIKGRGWGVWAGKRLDCKDKAHEFDIVLNLTGFSIKEQHVIPIPELKKWESHGKDITEIKLDWVDYGIVRLPRQFWADLIAYAKKHNSRILVFCEGGHGRTGTAVACLMVVGLGLSAKEAMDWIRTNYCEEAIESMAQEYYIESIERQGTSKQLETKEAEVKSLVQTKG